MNSSNSFFIIALLIISSFFYNSAKAENITSELHSGIAKYKYSFGEFKYYTFDDAADAYMLEKSHCITQPEFYVSCEIYDRRYEELTVYYTATTINDSNVNHFFHIQTITVSEYRCPSTHPYVLVVYEDTSTYAGQPKTCSDIEPTCDCTEDLVDNQCVARTDFEYDFNNDNPEKIFTTPNNQGEYCEAPVSDEAPQPCPPDAANTPSVETENPINCASGVKRQTEVDYSSSVGGLNFRRTYSSTPISKKTLERLYTQDGQTIPDNAQVVGSHAQLDKSYHQWRVEGLPVLNLDNRYPGLTIARLALPSGSELNFLQRDSETGWTAQYQKNGALINDGTGYRYTSQSGTLYQFDAQGRLTSKTYRNGQSHSVSYPSSNHAIITDSFNRSIELFFEDIPQSLTSSSRIITKLVDPAGNEYRYEHDNAGYISKVIYPDETPSDWTDNPYKEYLYEDRTDTKVLIGIMDENGERYATYDYDAKNRAVLSEHAGGAIKTTIDYLDSTAVDQSLVRFYRDDVNYREAVYHHALLNGSDKVTKLEQLPCLGCTVGDYTYDYDANGFLSQATSPDGDITTYQYNTRGLLESKTEAFGTSKARTVTITWHSQYKLPLTVDQPQRLTTYSYDANGNLLSRSVKDKATNETRSVSYTYNSVGQVLTIDGPRTDVSDITTYEYDTSGNLTKITNAMGHATFITSHDAHGKPLSVTDPNGTVTTLTYHPRGWLTSITTDGATTSYDYDNAGQLISVTMANGIVLNYEYDAAHRLVAIADANGNRIEYTLDNYGNRTRTEIKDTGGVIQSYAEQVFNDLGQLKQTLGANNQVNDFNYDAEGKPVQSEDALDNPTSQQFDALDRLQKVVDPALGETEFDYDNQDRLTSVTDATGKTTSYQYNAFGDLLSMTSPDTGTSTMTYDSAGNVLTATDARNITATYSYDALNRVTSIDYPGTGEDITFTYDDTANGNKGVGRLTQVTDESGSTSYEYDAKGQLVNETRIINGLSFTTGYDYDAAGLITQVTYPSGRTVDYQRNNLGQVIAATTTANGQTQTLANNISYLPFGPLTNLTYGNGKVLTQSFDQDYRLTSKHTTGLQQLSYGYTLRNNINSISDLMDSTKNQAFSYDALGRLTDASGDYGTQSYTFDGIGNRLSKTQDGVTENYTYSSTDHQLQSVGSTNLTYDAIGNTLTKGDLTFTYNQAGRLVTASKTGMNASYSYNAQGQRVKKVVDDGTSSETTLYHYDQGGQLIAETDGQGNLLKEYLYLDGQRLATVDNGNLYYIHTDHLGSPLALTDNYGTVQWKGSYDPYGNVTVEVNNLDQNQRFPGQYADEETGLHYNYFRDYDPEIGRYIQSDPIGLNGGINTYGYVGGNPVNRTDRKGLCVDPGGSGTRYCIDLFIPNESEKGFHGDNRGPMANGGTHRGRQLIFNQNGVLTKKEIPGITIFEPFGIELGSAPGKAGPSSLSSYEDDECSCKRQLSVSNYAGNALADKMVGFEIAPYAGYEFTLSEKCDGSTDISGFHTRFPSFEVWQYKDSGNPKLIYHYDSNAAGTSSLNIGGRKKKVP
jgi:RHS repeat-associated protein